MSSRFPWWFWVSMAPLGLGAWAPLVPGTRLRRRSWQAWGALWSALAVAAWFLAGASDSEDNSLAGGLIILAWAGAVATAASIRPTYVRELGSSWDTAKRAAQARLEEREDALRMAAADPRLARELGIGRPDVPGASAGGVVDVNHAGAEALATLPGVDAALADRIVAVREEINGFGSLPDMGGVLHLDGNAVERLRGHVVFLPR